MAQSNKRKEICEILQRFIEHKYSEEDVNAVIEYIAENDSDKRLKSICSDYWYHHFDKPGSTSGAGSDFESILDTIHHRLNLEDNSLMRSGSRRRIGKIVNTSLQVFYRMSAIIVVALMLAGLYNVLENNRLFQDKEVAYTEIVAPLGSKIKIELPDGSKAWLNHGTVLKYPNKFGNRTREVFLTGEAYFDVKEDRRHPFVLKTSDVNVRVLGTSFNILAYEDDPEVEITLETGKLDIYVDSSSDKIARLRPGEHFILDRNSKKINRHSGKTDKYTGWKDGYMIFRGDPLEVIVKKLERWYNVEIEISDPELSSYRFTATFTEETLPQILNLLTVAVPMEYTILPRKKQADNMYSKSKVFLQFKTECQ